MSKKIANLTVNCNAPRSQHNTRKICIYQTLELFKVNAGLSQMNWKVVAQFLLTAMAITSAVISCSKSAKPVAAYFQRLHFRICATTTLQLMIHLMQPTRTLTVTVLPLSHN